MEVPGVPIPMHWLRSPREWRLGDRQVRIRAEGGTNWFVDPAGDRTVVDAPTLLAHPSGDYQWSAKVHVGFEAVFDAGVLVLFADARRWAKLCFEYSPQHEPMVVSVVTRGVSDDSNSFIVDGQDVWLRVSRLGPVFAFHASTDGDHWQMIRYFELGQADDLAVGLLAQSPTDSGCEVSFSEISYVAVRLADLRTGV